MKAVTSFLNGGKGRSFHCWKRPSPPKKWGGHGDERGSTGWRIAVLQGGKRELFTKKKSLTGSGEKPLFSMPAKGGIRSTRATHHPNGRRESSLTRGRTDLLFYSKPLAVERGGYYIQARKKQDAKGGE